MIVAKLGNDLVEAERHLGREAYTCPLCGHGVVLKPGRVKIPHFAHAPGADCPAAAHEGLAHLATKKVLAKQFRILGYDVRLEEQHGDRRIDVAVTLPTGHRVAVELQDSPISVDAMKVRMAADRRHGFFGTTWTWIGKRYSLLRQAADNGEGRIPEEVRWLSSRLGVGVYGLNVDTADLALGGSAPLPPEHFTFGSVSREGHEATWYEAGGVEVGVSYQGRTLKATKRVGSREVSFRLASAHARYHKPERPDWTVVFADPRRSA